MIIQQQTEALHMCQWETQQNNTLDDMKHHQFITEGKEKKLDELVVHEEAGFES